VERVVLRECLEWRLKYALLGHYRWLTANGERDNIIALLEDRRIEEARQRRGHPHTVREMVHCAVLEIAACEATEHLTLAEQLECVFWTIESSYIILVCAQCVSRETLVASETREGAVGGAEGALEVFCAVPAFTGCRHCLNCFGEPELTMLNQLPLFPSAHTCMGVAILHAVLFAMGFRPRRGRHE
jgi:hypothetical protein